jgi:hypothetical protein
VRRDASHSLCLARLRAARDVILLLRLRQGPPGRTVSAIYTRDLFDPETIGHMLEDC